jgi:hypothetical protein
MNSLNQIQVKCSCGRSTLLLWIPLIGEYRPADVAFVYADGRGWTCGGAGHSMAKLGTMTKADYHEAMRRAEERSNEGDIRGRERSEIKKLLKGR